MWVSSWHCTSPHPYTHTPTLRHPGSLSSDADGFCSTGSACRTLGPDHIPPRTNRCACSCRAWQKLGALSPSAVPISPSLLQKRESCIHYSEADHSASLLVPVPLEHGAARLLWPPSGISPHTSAHVLEISGTFCAAFNSPTLQAAPQVDRSYDLKNFTLK